MDKVYLNKTALFSIIFLFAIVSCKKDLGNSFKGQYIGTGKDLGSDYVLLQMHPDTTLIVTRVNKKTIEINGEEYEVKEDGTFGGGYSSRGGYTYYSGGSFKGDSIFYATGSNLNSYNFIGKKN